MIGDGRIRIAAGRIVHSNGVTIAGTCCPCPCGGDVLSAAVTVSNPPEGCTVATQFDFMMWLNYHPAGKDLCLWWLQAPDTGDWVLLYCHKPTGRFYAYLTGSGSMAAVFAGNDVEYNGQPMKDVTDDILCQNGVLSGTFDLDGTGACAGATAHVTLTHPSLPLCPCLHDRPKLTVTVSTSGNYTEYQTCQSLAGEYHCGAFFCSGDENYCSLTWYFYLLNYPIYGAQIDPPLIILSYDSASGTWSADLVTPAGPTAFSGNSLSVSCSNGQLSGTFTLNAVGFYCTGTAVITIGRP